MGRRWIHLSVSIAAICILLAPPVPAGEPEPNFIVIDDFESYDDGDVVGTRIYETWIDGYTDNLSGSIVGPVDPDEWYPIHAGHESMLFEYDNVSLPYYSQTYRTWDTPQDWTVGHAADLSLWLRGRPCLFLAQPDGRIVMSVPPVDVTVWFLGVFSFGYRQLDGDGAIVARVEAVATAEGSARAGVMICGTPDHIQGQYVAVVVTTDHWLAYEYRRTPDGKLIRDLVKAVAAPHWLKLVRTGDTFTAQHSADGATWQDVRHLSGPPLTLVEAMPANSCIGLCMTGYRSPQVSTAQFSAVAFTGRVASEWQVTGYLSGNSRENLYVALEDSDGRIGTAVHPDRAAVNFLEWTEWKIPLHDFSRLGVDLKSVRRMYLRVGDKNARQPGGRGRIYIDDICLLPRAQAAAPSPADGDVNVSQTPVLKWSPGGMAAEHDIYLGTDPNAVANATPATAGIYRERQGRGGDEMRYEPGELEWNRIYWWRVDEVNDAHPESPWRGPVWRFTTADFLVIEDFEDWPGPDCCIGPCPTWIDGYLDGRSGSLIGNLDPPFAEQVIVHSGGQSLPLDYNNVSEPFYSEIRREFSLAQDWTVHGGDSLVLYVRGLATNDPAPLYLSVEDSAGTAFGIIHPDSELTRTTEWTEWKVPLSRLAGFDWSRMTGFDFQQVAQIRIGAGNPEAPAPGGRGRIYLDDIRVIKSAP